MLHRLFVKPFKENNLMMYKWWFVENWNKRMQVNKNNSVFIDVEKKDNCQPISPKKKNRDAM